MLLLWSAETLLIRNFLTISASYPLRISYIIDNCIAYSELNGYLYLEGMIGKLIVVMYIIQYISTCTTSFC